jgi:hypothetical protein
MKKIFTPCLTFLLLFLFTGRLSAQVLSVDGSTSDLNAFYGSSIIVDNTLTITSPTDVTNASVLIATNYMSGDLLTVDNGALPVGATTDFNPATGRLTITGTGTAAEWQTALRTVQFTTSSFSAGTRTVVFTIGNAIYNVSNGHYYEFITTGDTWTAGKSAAEASTLFGLTGYLATITSIEENVFLSSKLQSDGWIACTDDYLEINAATGATTYADQSFSEGMWYWVSGPEKGIQFCQGNSPTSILTFSTWADEEPNNYGTENFGQIYYGNNGMWNDLPDNASLGAVVEYGDMPGDPVVDLVHSRAIIVTMPTLLGDTATPAYFENNNSDYLIDGSLEFDNVDVVTDFTVNISQGFQDGDELTYPGGVLPIGVTANYNAVSGVLNFTGTGTKAEWNTLLHAISFKTSSSVRTTRKVTFNMGTEPASAEGHFYKMSGTQVIYYDIPNYIAWYEPEISRYMGMPGTLVNIQSAAENDFLKSKTGNDFWLPLSDEFNMINQMIGGPDTYFDQSETEGTFYWLTGSQKGIRVSTGNFGTLVPEAGVYNNWEAAEPDNIGNASHASYFNVLNGAWYDETLYDDFGYLSKNVLIEYEVLPGDPLLNTIFTKTLAHLSTLPVTLVSFDVKKDNKTVLAEWKTTNESNNNYFSIERSADQRTFVSIGVVNANRNLNRSLQYQFIDKYPLEGINYYRLKQVDLGGSYKYSLIRQVEFRKSGPTSQLFPTLATDNIKVQLGSIPSGVTCSIINSAGMVVKQFKPSTASFNVSVQTLRKGVYIFKIMNANGNEESLRFVKQ